MLGAAPSGQSAMTRPCPRPARSRRRRSAPARGRGPGGAPGPGPTSSGCRAGRGPPPTMSRSAVADPRLVRRAGRGPGGRGSARAAGRRARADAPGRPARPPRRAPARQPGHRGPRRAKHDDARRLVAAWAAAGGAASGSAVGSVVRSASGGGSCGAGSTSTSGSRPGSAPARVRRGRAAASPVEQHTRPSERLASGAGHRDRGGTSGQRAASESARRARIDQGGMATAPARGAAIGATAIQVFTKTPNQWREPVLGRGHRGRVPPRLARSGITTYSVA